ncbi:HEPN domain-containing protein [Kribbella sp. ALI-6-A]|uniref:HEPN domain-containing protein n=1 Tax=Kribbella sp. ALI-6-A TaxID=1933817 RepID=UPI00117AEC85|nr:HEPN domain-containing protein [Kribbella sp. ALI-6-A]
MTGQTQIWNVADTTRKLTGSVDLTLRRPTVSVDGELTPAYEERATNLPGETEVVDLPFGPEQEQIFVHAEAPDIGAITIAEGYTSGRNFDPNAQIITGRWALVGGHVDAETKYVSARVRIQNFDFWRRAYIAGLDPETRRPIIVKTAEEPPCPVPHLGGNAEIRLEETSDGGEDYWIVLDGVQLNLERILKDFVKPLSDLATIAIGSQSWSVSIQLRTSADSPWSILCHPLLDTPHPVPPKAKREHQVVHYADVRLQGLAAWLANSVSLDVIPTLVAGQVGRTGPSLEIRLLVLASAAEGYHRRIHPHERRLSPEQIEKIPPAISSLKDRLDSETRAAMHESTGYLDEPVFRKRMHSLAEVVETILPGLTGVTDNWTKVVAKHRNRYAHRLPVEDEDATKLFFEMLAIQQSLRWLLTVLLLIKAGISSEILAIRATRNHEWSSFVLTRTQYLPSVYRRI